MTTIVVGELPRSCDPAVSEWGNPPDGSIGEPRASVSGERLELKHLSRGRKRNYNQLKAGRPMAEDSVSSGERKRKSLNPAFGGVLRDYNMGVIWIAKVSGKARHRP